MAGIRRGVNMEGLQEQLTQLQTKIVYLWGRL